PNISPPSLRFSFQDAVNADRDWGMNCGPGALAGVTGRMLDEVRKALPEFGRGRGQKHYTNAEMMRGALENLGVVFKITETQGPDLPEYGLARVQWEGPWTEPGQPWEARQRHTHWIGFDAWAVEIFDINAIWLKKGRDGWLWADDWESEIKTPLLA